MDDKKFQDIPGYEGFYMINKIGEIKSLKRIVYGKDGRKMNVKEKILKQPIGTHGYRYVMLCKNKKRPRTVHRLMAKTFLSLKNEKLEVNHIDGDKLNNKISNLEITTRNKNIKHSYDIGLRDNQIKGIIERAKKRTIPIIQKDLEGLIVKRWDSAIKAAEHYRVSASSIRDCIYGNSKTSCGYKWEYDR